MIKEGKFLRIGLELLEMLDEQKTYEVQLALTLLYLVKPQYEWYGDCYVRTTPSLLIRQFGNYEKLNQRQQKNVLDAINDLKCRGLINFDEDLKFKNELFINTQPLLVLAEKGSFIKININDFISIMEDDEPIMVEGKEKSINGIESLLLLTFMSISGHFDNKSIKKLLEFDDGEVARDINTDEKLQKLKYVFCNASLDFLRSHKHPSLPTIENWIDDDYLSPLIFRLVDLGLLGMLKRKVRNEQSKWINMNFYYPAKIPEQNMIVMISQYAKRMNYAIKCK